MTTTTISGFDLDTIRDHLTSTGFAYITALPYDFAHRTELARLGPLVPQYGDALIRDITPDPAIGADVVSAANMGELTPHTEWYEFPGTPPRYVALWCVHPADGPGGETTLADGYQLLDLFSPAQREQLTLDLRQWRSRPTLAREGVTEVAYHPIVDQHNGVALVRFSTLDMRTDDDLSRIWITTGQEFFSDTKTPIKIAKGAVLVWDNWRMLHARNAFTDPGRHLRRVLIANR